MRIVFPNGDDARPSLTDKQIASVKRISEQYQLPEPVTVDPGFGGDYVMVNVGTMVLGIEKDGYTHS